MKSNTEGWSNKQLNDRIEELEDRLEAIRKWKQRIGFKFPLMEDTCHLYRYDLLELEKILEETEK